MEFTGRIMKVLEPRTGTSERTGNEWKSQGFVFEYFEHQTDRYSDKVYLETFDTNIMDQLKENLPVRIGFGHHVREFTNQQGKTIQINEIRMYKFEAQCQVLNPSSQPQSDGGTGAAPNAEAPATGTAPFPPEAPTGEGGKADDLPF